MASGPAPGERVYLHRRAGFWVQVIRWCPGLELDWAKVQLCLPGYIRVQARLRIKAPSKVGFAPATAPAQPCPVKGRRMTTSFSPCDRAMVVTFCGRDPAQPRSCPSPAVVHLAGSAVRNRNPAWPRSAAPRLYSSSPLVPPPNTHLSWNYLVLLFYVQAFAAKGNVRAPA